MTNPVNMWPVPFAVNGQKNPIEITRQPDQDAQDATVNDGFPPVTMQRKEVGGLPPKGTDFNGIFYVLSENMVHRLKGEQIEFDSDYATKIGGYPLNSRLSLTNGTIVRSTIANNSNNPNTSMTGWELDSLSPPKNLSDVVDKASARENLSVYSKSEIDTNVKLNQATEAVAGKAKIATTAIVQAGTNNTDIVTPQELSGFISSNVLTNNFVDVMGSRVIDTVYTNPSPSKWMTVKVCFELKYQSGRNQALCYVNGKLNHQGGISKEINWVEYATLFVPPAGNYKISGTAILINWRESV